MAEDKQFKLSKDLEDIIKGVNTNEYLHEQALRKPGKDNINLREQAENFYNSMHQDGYLGCDGRMMKVFEPGHFIDALRDGKDEFVGTLDSRLDDKTYKEARATFTKGLDESVKRELYAEMLRNGIMPKELEKDADKKKKEAYAALQFAKRTLDFAEALEVHASKGDVKEALAEIAGYTKDIGRKDVFNESHLRALQRLSAYGAPVARENETQILEHIARVHRNLAGKIIEDNKLYDLIESGVENTKYGKAIALKSMYNAYTQQQAINKSKEKAKK